MSNLTQRLARLKMEGRQPAALSWCGSTLTKALIRPSPGGWRTIPTGPTRARTRRWWSISSPGNGNGQRKAP
jgi:hypothetical protein